MPWWRKLPTGYRKGSVPIRRTGSEGAKNGIKTKAVYRDERSKKHFAIAKFVGKEAIAECTDDSPNPSAVAQACLPGSRERVAVCARNVFSVALQERGLGK